MFGNNATLVIEEYKKVNLHLFVEIYGPQPAPYVVNEA